MEPKDIVLIVSGMLGFISSLIMAICGYYFYFHKLDKAFPFIVYPGSKAQDWREETLINLFGGAFDLFLRLIFPNSKIVHLDLEWMRRRAKRYNVPHYELERIDPKSVPWDIKLPVCLGFGSAFFGCFCMAVAYWALKTSPT